MEPQVTRTPGVVLTSSWIPPPITNNHSMSDNQNRARQEIDISLNINNSLIRSSGLSGQVQVLDQPDSKVDRGIDVGMNVSEFNYVCKHAADFDFKPALSSLSSLPFALFSVSSISSCVV